MDNGPTLEKYYYTHPPLQPHEVRCRVLYASLCQSDVLTVRAKWGQFRKPLCPGHEVVARVIEAGSEVTRVQVGDTVCFGPQRDSCSKCRMCDQGEEIYCRGMMPQEQFLYGKYWGGYSTHIQQPAKHCLKIPPGVDLPSFAPFLCAGVTVFSPIRRHAKKGMNAAVIGIGGLGHLAVQFLSKMGCRVHAWSTSESKKELALQLGAEKLVLWKRDGVLDLMDHYDLVVSTVSANLEKEQLENICDVLRPFGKLIFVGAPPVHQSTPFQPQMLLFKNLSFVGSLVGSLKDYELMFEFIRKHGIKSIVEFEDFENFP